MAKRTASSCVTGSPGVWRSTRYVRSVRTTTECRIYHVNSSSHCVARLVRSPAAFKPSCHMVGVHGDLYRCRECGTVHQPSLPQGNELHDLYREMSDDSYLVEEAGRRRTARRLLDLLAAHVARGRLLEVGCGHGLLLDEARRRGYERSRARALGGCLSYARETLGLAVREATLEGLSTRAECYDAVVLVNVLEHVDDPVEDLSRACALLAPGGVLMIATPDPSSRVATASPGDAGGLTFLPTTA